KSDVLEVFDRPQANEALPALVGLYLRDQEFVVHPRQLDPAGTGDLAFQPLPGEATLLVLRTEVAAAVVPILGVLILVLGSPALGAPASDTLTLQVFLVLLAPRAAVADLLLLLAQRLLGGRLGTV